VTGAALRYQVDAADGFRLGESVRLVAYPGDHTAYEAPELAAGRRVRRDDEAEVGVGLAQALNLHPGATMALQLDAGPEVRFRVVGLVRAIPNEGRIVYVRPRRLLAADPSLPPTIAIRVRAGARDAVERALTAHGFYASEVGGVASDVRHTGFLRVLSALLRTVAALDGLVCLYAVAQMLALTAQERRRALAIVRACGADGRQMLRLFAGSALVVAALAAPVGIVLERNVLGPAVSNLAAAYAELPLAARLGSILVVVVGLAAAALAASGWTARAAAAEPVVAGLRDD
jgi:hypothetical protein